MRTSLVPTYIQIEVPEPYNEIAAQYRAETNSIPRVGEKIHISASIVSDKANLDLIVQDISWTLQVARDKESGDLYVSYQVAHIICATKPRKED